MRHQRNALILASLAVLVFAAPAGSQLATIRGEGTRVLKPGRYDRVLIEHRSGGWLKILADGATVKSLRILGARNVKIAGMTLRGRAEVAHSRNVVLDRFKVRGPMKSRIRVRRSTGVEITNSSFWRCGERTACVILRFSNGVRLQGNHFRECRGCDFVFAWDPRSLVVWDNVFGDALPGPCGNGGSNCNHNDLIQIRHGAKILVERNRFGYQSHGAAQVYLSGKMDHVVVRNNVLRAGSPVGIRIGNSRDRAVPTGVLVAHNTILSGGPHASGADSSVAFSPLYATVEETLRPLLVNNVLAALRTPAWVCGLVVTRSNIVREGEVCSETDVLADPLLEAEWGRPGAGSLTVDRAEAGWADDDVDGRDRGDAPDVGAYELVP